MGRPKHPDQCIGRYPESNERMRAAWKQAPAQGQTVWVLAEKSQEFQEWCFSWFTLAGARLYKKVDNNHYSRLINWDKGDMLFTSLEDLYTMVAYNAIARKAAVDLESRTLEDKINSILQTLNQMKVNK